MNPAEKSRTVYVLRCSDNSVYVGCTNNLDNRLYRHEKGQVMSTKYRLTVKVIKYAVFSYKYKAYNFEKYLKSGSGRAFLNKRLI